MKAEEKKAMLSDLNERLAKLYASLDAVQREHLLAHLRINERAKNALLSANYRTVSDVCESDCEDLARLKNVGGASLSSLCADLEREYHVRHKNHTLSELVSEASYGLKYRDILFRRLGIEGHRRETLDEIGRSLSMTRERIRQIEAMSVSEILTGLRGEDIRTQIRFLAFAENDNPEVAKMLEGIDRPDKLIRSLLKSVSKESNVPAR